MDVAMERIAMLGREGRLASARRAARRRRAVFLWLPIWILVVACAEERVGLDLAISHFDHVTISSAGLAHVGSDSVSVAVQRAGVVIDGSFRLPDHCDELRAGLHREGSDVEVRVRAARAHSHHDCEGSDRTIVVAYTVTVRNLPPDRYDFRVVYEDHSTDAANGRSRTVRRTLFKSQLRVP